MIEVSGGVGVGGPGAVTTRAVGEDIPAQWPPSETTTWKVRPPDAGRSAAYVHDTPPATSTGTASHRTSPVVRSVNVAVAVVSDAGGAVRDLGDGRAEQDLDRVRATLGRRSARCRRRTSPWRTPG